MKAADPLLIRRREVNQMGMNSNRYGTLGVLWGIYGVVMIAAAAWMIAYDRTLTVMWGAIISRVANPFAWMDAFHLFLGATVVMALISGLFSLLAAFALMSGAGSARRMGLIAAAFGMLGTPPGVTLGVFTVAILFPIGTGGPA
jgi:hypothetical protein